jgi:hypothetical protein
MYVWSDSQWEPQILKICYIVGLFIYVNVTNEGTVKYVDLFTYIVPLSL